MLAIIAVSRKLILLIKQASTIFTMKVELIFFFFHSLWQEEVVASENGSEDVIATLEANSVFGEIAVLCNIPQPYTVRVSELSRLLRIEKQAFNGILQLYFKDSRQVLNNLLKVLTIEPIKLLTKTHIPIKLLAKTQDIYDPCSI